MRRVTLSIIGALLLLLLILASGSTFLTDWLWFASMGQAVVFWTRFLTNAAVRLFSFGFPFLFLLVNLLSVVRAFRRPRPAEEMPYLPADLPWSWIALLLAALLSFFVAAAFKPSWTAVQTFLHAVKVGETDPVLGLDLGYYLFRFPLWQRINGLLQSVLWLSLLVVGLAYWAARAFWRHGTRYLLWPQAKLHLTLLAALLLLTKIWGYTLARQGLLLAEGSLLTGVDYTAAIVRLPVYQILSFIAAGCLLLLFVGLFRRGVRFLVFGLGLLFVASFLLGTLYPAFIRSMVVKPNEFRLEEPYLARHIAATRRAFGLDRFVVRDYPLATEKPSSDDPTLANLRLWDFRPLKSSYEQLQTIRPYYTFHDIDVDRYRIGGQKRQVMLAARELDPTELPANAKNWVNLHLSYTHGYGLVMNATGEVNPEGQPVFLIGNIPPVVAEGSELPRIARPQIYFGETQSGYLIVPNGYQEFDYPAAEGENAVTTYHGRDGIPVGSFWRKLLFAFRF
ncbi:MAG: COG1615 family transporter [Firmicutes bacterium]|nr:COG1615 family transporter [Bacillota bacterium]